MRVVENLFNINDNCMLQSFVVEEPEECPLCHYSIKPMKLSIHYYDHEETKNVAGLYLCNHCFRVFAALSVATESDYITVYSQKGLKTELKYVGPTCFADKVFEPEVNNLSPQFVKIYNQALHAEQIGLDEIAGIGYRKSLEFLVKDYCIHLHPEQEETIKSRQLAQCIREFIDVPQIKVLAEKATWIGNDETHYIRKQEDRNISDMKRFIDAMVNYVRMSLITEDAETITSK